jgi:hypothetical protein
MWHTRLFQQRGPSPGDLVAGQGALSLRPEEEARDELPLAAMSATGALEVRMAPSSHRYEVRQLGDQVARLELLKPVASMAARATALDKEWRFAVERTGRWSWNGVAREQPRGHVVGAYHPIKVRNARILLGDSSYVLRRPWVSDVWRLGARDGAGCAVIRTKASLRAPLRFEIDLDFAAGTTQPPLLVLLAIWGMLLEPNFVFGESSGGS